MSDIKHPSRRSFLKTLGGAAAAAAAFGVAGRDLPEPLRGIAQARTVDKPPYEILPTIQRFSEANTTFARATGLGGYAPDPELQAWLAELPLREVDPEQEAIGIAFRNGANYARNYLKYTMPDPVASFKVVRDPAEMTEIIKLAAKFYGADLVGVTEVNPLWVYQEADVPYKYVIVFAMEMDYELHRIPSAPFYPGGQGAATGKGYSDMVNIAGSLARMIRHMGYDAMASGNDVSLSVPMAIDAGLGELGRAGWLITPEFGPRIRLARVFTDLPLVPDKPIEFGVADFCSKCKKCARECPSQAISDGEPTTVGPTKSNNPGARKWYLNPELCYGFWVSNRTGGCSDCIRVCPYNKKPGVWVHELAVAAGASSGLVRSTLVELDDAFGYAEGEDWSRWAELLRRSAEENTK